MATRVMPERWQCLQQMVRHYVWGPLQAILEINTNSPSCNDEKIPPYQFMYEWSAAQENLVLITGHTHQPVFNSLTHLERLYKRLAESKLSNDKDQVKLIELEIIRKNSAEPEGSYEKFLKLKPSYFNSGCCCFNDGDISGIEIADGMIRLIKWITEKEKPHRVVLEETPLETLAAQL